MSANILARGSRIDACTPLQYLEDPNFSHLFPETYILLRNPGDTNFSHPVLIDACILLRDLISLEFSRPFLIDACIPLQDMVDTDFSHPLLIDAYILLRDMVGSMFSHSSQKPTSSSRMNHGHSHNPGRHCHGPADPAKTAPPGCARPRVEQGHDRPTDNQHEDNSQTRTAVSNRTPPSMIDKSQTNSHFG